MAMGKEKRSKIRFYSASYFMESVTYISCVICSEAAIYKKLNDLWRGYHYQRMGGSLIRFMHVLIASQTKLKKEGEAAQKG